MKVYEGTVELIGAGSWRGGGFGGTGTRKLSALEIGNKTFKNINLSDYISNYLKPGEYVRVLIYKGLTSSWLKTSFVAAVEVNNKKHKIGGGRILLIALAKIFLFCMFFGIIGLLVAGIAGATTSMAVAYIVYFSTIFVCLYYIWFQLKGYFDLMRF